MLEKTDLGELMEFAGFVGAAMAGLCTACGER